jgi:hypothetical protein
MTSTYLPELLLPEEAANREVRDVAMAAAVTAVIKRLGEQRHSRLGHLHHTEFELVLVRLDQLANKPGFEDLYVPALVDWRIWYNANERKLDTLAYRPVPGGKEYMKVGDDLR